MGLIGTALQIGRSALLSYQSALQVVGNNISNAGNVDYTRQTISLAGRSGGYLPEGFQIGAGVALTALQRNIDEALENRLRTGLADQGSTTVAKNAMARLEAILNELSDNDLSTLMQKFFNSLSALQNAPHEVTSRGVVLNSATALIHEIQRQRTDVLMMVDELNSSLKDVTLTANRLSGEIAALNDQIVAAESGSPGSATALRDRRDARLRELSSILAIHVQPQPTGAVNVYIGNEPLVQDGISRGLTTTTEIGADQVQRVVVRFADHGGPVSVLGGQIEGLVASRDQYAVGHLNDLDTLAKALIQEVNKVHSQGQGLEGLRSAVGTYAVRDAAAALNSGDAGLDLLPRNGSFQITVTNRATGASQTTTIEVDLDGLNGDDTTLTSLAAALDAVGNISSRATADGRLEVVADDGYDFTFGEDTSYALAALGVNTFFDGTASYNIALNAAVNSNPLLLAAGRSRLPGDGTNAAAMAKVATQAVAMLGGISINDYYSRVAGRTAVTGAAARAAEEASNSILTSLQAQRESLSGVSLDEEAVQLLKFERAFQGAARYVSVVNDLIDEMLALVS